MKKTVVLGIASLFLSCSGRHTKLGSGSNYGFGFLQTKVCEYYQQENCDSVHETDDFIPFECLGITGYRLSEVIQKYGTPVYESLWKDFTSGSIEGHPSFRWLSSVIEALKINKPIDVLEMAWTPHENKDLVIRVYFIADGNNLIAVTGCQENRAIYLME